MPLPLVLSSFYSPIFAPYTHLFLLPILNIPQICIFFLFDCPFPSLSFILPFTITLSLASCFLLTISQIFLPFYSLHLSVPLSVCLAICLFAICSAWCECLAIEETGVSLCVRNLTAQITWHNETRQITAAVQKLTVPSERHWKWAKAGEIQCLDV